MQLAKWSRAKVFTTIRKNEDIALAKSLGADEVINIQEEDVEKYKKRLTNNQGFEIIFDTVGGENLDNSLAATAVNGTIVTIAARSTHDLTPMHSKGLSLHCVMMLLPLLNNQHRENYGKILEKISNIVDEGKLKPIVDPHQYILQDVSQAHQLLESGKAFGKIVITIAQ